MQLYFVYKHKVNSITIDWGIKVKVTTVRSNVKSRSHHDIAHLQLPTSVPTKYQLPTPYAFIDIAEQDFIDQGHNGKVKGQSKVTPWHCTPTPPNQCSYEVSTSYILQFLRYRLDKLFPLPARPTIRTPWVKTIPQQPLRLWGKNHWKSAYKCIGHTKYISSNSLLMFIFHWIWVLSI